MGLAKPLHLRLFLEGVEVPVISAQVSVGFFAPAAASIQIVPLDEGLDFKPRTMVHLFFLEEPLSGKSGHASLASMRGENGQDTALSDERYKLFFCGEIVGFSFVKTPMSRSIVLQCLDHSAYWDSLQATMMDYGPQGNAFVSKASVYASNDAIFASVPTQGQAEKLRTWILGHAQTPGLEQIRGLAGGILNMMEQMGGVRHHTLGVNDFFTLAELRCHLLAQVAAEDADNTSQKLLDVSVFFDWLYGNLQNQPGQISLRDMFKLLCEYVYYAVIPNPIAYYKGPTDPNAPKKVKVPPHKSALKESRYYGPGLSVIQDVGMSMGDVVSEQTARNLKTSVDDVLVPAAKELKQDKLSSSITSLSKALGDLADSIAKKDTARVTAYTGKVKLLNQNLYTAWVEAGKVTVNVPGSEYTVIENARLPTQIFRPDCYMAAPPTCNVIFPEQYTQIAYDRNFLSEVTRVELQYYNKVTGNDALTAQHILQPNIHEKTNLVAKNMKNKWRVLMDHELHTGIIAREEAMPDSFSNLRQGNVEDQKRFETAKLQWSQKTGLHHFFKYRIAPRTLNGAGRFMPNLVCGFPAVVIQKPFYPPSWAANLSENDFLEQIKKSTNPSEELEAPPQFLGMIEGFSHNISQEGATTQFTMSHVRNHLGIDDEFIGVVMDELFTKAKKTQRVQYQVTYQSAKNRPKILSFLRDCTPQSAEANSSAAVSEQIQSNSISYQSKTGAGKVSTKTSAVKSKKQTKVTSAKTLAVADSPDQLGAAGAVIKVPEPPGVRTVGSKGLRDGKIVQIQVTDSTVLVDAAAKYYASILVVEDIEVLYTEKVPAPVEKIFIPAWMSTSYDPDKVGPRVYSQFFGCGSIVDQINVTGSPAEDLRDPKGVPTTVDEDQPALLTRLQQISQQESKLSIEKAVNTIAYLYGRVRSERLDVDEFIETFTRRPIATKAEILGSFDLKVVPQSGKPSYKVTAGKLGFHSLSLAPELIEKGNLSGLMDDPAMQLSRMTGTQRQAVAAQYDVRWAKLQKVRKYQQALLAGGRGFVG